VISENKIILDYPCFLLFTVFTQIQDENFFLIHHLKNGGSSNNRAQSSKNRANVFVTSNTINICLG
jgi:hypothetical protein